jgi:hypothetical protein
LYRSIILNATPSHNKASSLQVFVSNHHGFKYKLSLLFGRVFLDKFPGLPSAHPRDFPFHSRRNNQ